MHIRDAIVADAEVSAPIIYSSAAQKYNYGIGSFGDDPVIVIESAFRQYAYAFYKVVESEGQVIGVAAYHTNQDALKVLGWAIQADIKTT